MKNTTLLLLSLILLLGIPLSSCTGKEEKRTGVSWLTNYEEAMTKAQQTSKPVILFFTGSDWCTWCNKLEAEVFDNKDFVSSSGDKFIFVKLDFPLSTPQAAPIAQQNKQLKEKYDIQGFPTLILLDEKERTIGETGYRAGGGKQYSTHLQKIIKDDVAYRSKLKSIENKKVSFEELQSLYQKADDLNDEKEMQRIIKLGLAVDKNNYFLTERYRFLVQEGLLHDDDTIAIRNQLLKADPSNNQMTHYNVAVIDFEGYLKEMQANNTSPELATAPLLEYIDKFGSVDQPQNKANIWRLHMLVAQVYIDQDNSSIALKHAQLAYSTAPQESKVSIQKVIENIQKQTKENS